MGRSEVAVMGSSSEVAAMGRSEVAATGSSSEVASIGRSLRSLVTVTLGFWPK